MNDMTHVIPNNNPFTQTNAMAARPEIRRGIKAMRFMTRDELIAHIRATAERMTECARLMQYYGGLGEIAEHGLEMEGAARIAHGWADEIAGDDP